jgi:hypothetical protein
MPTDLTVRHTCTHVSYVKKYRELTIIYVKNAFIWVRQCLQSIHFIAWSNTIPLTYKSQLDQSHPHTFCIYDYFDDEIYISSIYGDHNFKIVNMYFGRMRNDELVRQTTYKWQIIRELMIYDISLKLAQMMIHIRTLHISHFDVD